MKRFCMTVSGLIALATVMGGAKSTYAAAHYWQGHGYVYVYWNGQLTWTEWQSDYDFDAITGEITLYRDEGWRIEYGSSGAQLDIPGIDGNPSISAESVSACRCLSSLPPFLGAPRLRAPVQLSGRIWLRISRANATDDSRNPASSAGALSTKSPATSKPPTNPLFVAFARR